MHLTGLTHTAAPTLFHYRAQSPRFENCAANVTKALVHNVLGATPLWGTTFLQF